MVIVITVAFPSSGHSIAAVNMAFNGSERNDKGDIFNGQTTGRRRHSRRSSVQNSDGGYALAGLLAVG